MVLTQEFFSSFCIGISAISYSKKGLKQWSQDAAMAEEFFFATLARVDQRRYKETGEVVQGLFCPERDRLAIDSTRSWCHNFLAEYNYFSLQLSSLVSLK